VNAIFGSIPILSKKISNIKKGQPIPVHQFSGLVTQNFKSLNFIICFKKIFSKNCLTNNPKTYLF